ncbi:hypothetical protein ACQJ18_22615 [Priestia megaterium]|uniref:hypothetical protein n=1 Tax=Priestia megaterium TaxID=1404 RepID=UPI003D046122
MNASSYSVAFRKKFNKLKSECLLKSCFHEDNQCSDKIIKAHSIQNNKILNKLSEDGHVLMYTAAIGNEFDLVTTMKKEGRSKATTFSGFCGFHDKELFRAIEDGDYVVGNKEQEFLFAYRALAKEYFTKKTTTEMYKRMYSLAGSSNYEKINEFFGVIAKPTREDLIDISGMLSAHLLGCEDAGKRLELYRERMNYYLDNQNFDEIVTEVIELSKEHLIAVSSITFLERDLEENIINDLSDFQISLAPLFITVFPQDGKTYVLLSYFKRNALRYKFIKKQILNKTEVEQREIISSIVMNYCENFAVSPIKWKEIDEETRPKYDKKYRESLYEVDKRLSTEEKLNLFI